MPDSAFRGELVAALPALHRYALLLTGNEHDAGDLVQDTVVRGLQSADSFQGRASAAGWLRRIMHNLWVDGHRGRRELPSDQIADLVEAQWRDDRYTVDAARVAERAEDREELRDGLAHLPVIYRTAVVLHDGEGLTVAQVAEVTGTTVAAAKQRLRRGRMMLVSALAGASAVPGPGVPMRCWRARSQVSDYLDGALPPGSARALEAHLAGCTTCPPLYSALVATRDGLARALADRDPDSVVPPELVRRIEAHLAATR